MATADRFRASEHLEKVNPKPAVSRKKWPRLWGSKISHRAHAIRTSGLVKLMRNQAAENPRPRFGLTFRIHQMASTLAAASCAKCPTLRITVCSQKRHHNKKSPGFFQTTLLDMRTRPPHQHADERLQHCVTCLLKSVQSCNCDS